MRPERWRGDRRWDGLILYYIVIIMVSKQRVLYILCLCVRFVRSGVCLHAINAHTLYVLY